MLKEILQKVLILSIVLLKFFKLLLICLFFILQSHQLLINILIIRLKLLNLTLKIHIINMTLSINQIILFNLLNLLFQLLLILHPLPLHFVNLILLAPATYIGNLSLRALTLQLTYFVLFRRL